MSKSRPFDLINSLFRPVWEAKYKERYRATGQDLKEAKQFLELNDDIFDEIPDFQEHAVEYLKSNWQGWVEQKHPCHGFLRNYNTFAPRKVKEQVRRIQMIACPDCGMNHPATELCPKCQEAK
jgi:hypothetical protein